MTLPTDANNPTGTRGVIGVDKIGWKVLFLDPTDFSIRASLDMPERPHEVAISPDHRTAYVSIYGSGIYGDNPRPGQTVVIVDLERMRRIGEIDVSPLRAPHALMWGADGLLYVSCDHSGAVAVVDVAERQVAGTIDAGSHGCHMIAMLPDGSKLYAENEDDQPFVSVLDPESRRLIGQVPMETAAGITASPDGMTVLVTDAREPELAVIDAKCDAMTDRLRLEGHEVAAQRVRWSPDGRHVVVTSNDAPLVTVLDARLQRQRTFEVAPGPMGVAFHQDGKTALVANHGSGRITVVDLEAGTAIRDFAAGKGVETLAFY